MNDVLTTLAVLFAAIEIDLGIDSSPMLRGFAMAERMLRPPGAARDEPPAVVMRTPIRGKTSVSSQLVACSLPSTNGSGGGFRTVNS
jgi:hypothetical protein